MDSALSHSQWVVRVCLSAFAFIGVLGGTLQMALGQPDTTPRLDNLHRFMAGVYLSMGVICGWMAVTVASLPWARWNSTSLPISMSATPSP